MIFQNNSDMLKRRLYLSRFLVSFSNYSTNFWMTASRFFIVEPAFCESDKNHKFDNSKTEQSLFK